MIVTDGFSNDVPKLNVSECHTYLATCSHSGWLSPYRLLNWSMYCW
jgi:hypothetical protein